MPYGVLTMAVNVEDLIRIGQVSSVNAADCTCRVAFDDLEGLVSGDMRIVQPRTVAEQVFSLPEPGESVLCVFLPSGLQEGFVIGSYYAGGNRPPGGRADASFRRFRDGTVIEYDIGAKRLTIHAAGDVTVHAEGRIDVNSGTAVTITAPSIEMN